MAVHSLYDDHSDLFRVDEEDSDAGCCSNGKERL